MRMLKAMTLVATMGLVASACATRGFVRTELSEVDSRVSSLGIQFEATQDQVEQNQLDIEAVRQQADAAETTAQSATIGVDEARDQLIGIQEAIDEIRNQGQLTLTNLDERQATAFAIGRSELPDAARGLIDILITEVRAFEDQNVYFEIEGHTDSTGDAAFNMRLGTARAEVVQMYMYETHNVPLHRMNVVSFGEENPAASNDTAAGRTQNRRVVIKVRS